jgi:hypothetical protein
MEVDVITRTPEYGVNAPGQVRQIALPADARALSTLPRIDYQDAFLVDCQTSQDRTGEQWCRAVLEDAPVIVRAKLLCGWCALGLKLGSPWSARRVLGWEIRRRSPDFVLLGAGSRSGLYGELLFRREPRGMLFATFVRQQNVVARAVWAGLEARHRAVVRSLLDHAARREHQSWQRETRLTAAGWVT